MKIFLKKASLSTLMALSIVACTPGDTLLESEIIKIDGFEFEVEYYEVGTALMPTLKTPPLYLKAEITTHGNFTQDQIIKYKEYFNIHADKGIDNICTLEKTHTHSYTNITQDDDDLNSPQRLTYLFGYDCDFKK